MRDLFKELTTPILRYARIESITTLCSLMDANATGDQIIDEIVCILAADRESVEAHIILSPARSALFRLKAELLLQKRRLREALADAKMSVALEPYNKGNLYTLRKCVEGVRNQSVARQPIVLIITCEKFQDRCEMLYNDLVESEFEVRVVFGNGANVTRNYKTIIASSGDVYEELPSKIRDALMIVYEEYPAATAVLKIDDDVSLIDRDVFKRALRAIVQDPTINYAGQSLRSVKFRDWHFKKCSCSERNFRPLGKRTRGPYASGPCYYLSPVALSAFYDYNVRFPDEISGEVYEDVFVGRVLREMGTALSQIDFGELGASNVDSNPDCTNYDPDTDLHDGNSQAVSVKPAARNGRSDPPR